MAGFELRLEKSYWSKGFFNVGVDYQRFVKPQDGPMRIFLGSAPQPVVGGRVTRSANRNGTPRIHGNKALQEFFQRRWSIGDTVWVEFISPTAIRVRGQPDRNANDVLSQSTPEGKRVRR